MRFDVNRWVNSWWKRGVDGYVASTLGRLLHNIRILWAFLYPWDTMLLEVSSAWILCAWGVMISDPRYAVLDRSPRFAAMSESPVPELVWGLIFLAAGVYQQISALVMLRSLLNHDIPIQRAIRLRKSAAFFSSCLWFFVAWMVQLSLPGDPDCGTYLFLGLFQWTAFRRLPWNLTDGTDDSTGGTG